ncbi:hypothetical protein R2R35_00720 [Anaerocolumna sp. AGMB13020]|nr:hypothetical protein [Anaerocolumna sp. AGMB13020]WOO37048.1 hypothetical protein R2R35_00720 [Anaerocolumna sp. AGMB13020]
MKRNERMKKYSFIAFFLVWVGMKFAQKESKREDLETLHEIEIERRYKC